MVFVVNHVWQLGQDRMEKFTWDHTTQDLTYVKSIEDDKFTM